MNVNMMIMLPALVLLISAVEAFPFVATMPGVDSSLLSRSTDRQTKRDTCPFNPVHPGAAPYNPSFPYTGAKDGLPGTGVGGIKVPADGDTAHQFEAPGSNDIRGPCPGMNAAANYHFLSHDGIVTFEELVDAQQNMYNVGWDLAVFLTTLIVALDGDIVTGKVSLGCEATSRTAPLGGLALGDELGFNGHNKFESDTSLTRNDFFLANGDNYSFNGTLFGMMLETCQGNFNRDNMAYYRYQRYLQSQSTNPHFEFGAIAVGTFGAASFLYKSFPTNGGAPDLPTISSFFGAESDGNGGWVFNNEEKVPENWHNQESPYTLTEAVIEIAAQYLQYPVLFGGNAGAGNFLALDSFGAISDGHLNATTQNVLCLLYQLGTALVPSSISGVVTLPLAVADWVAGKLNPIPAFANGGCPLRIL